MDDVGLFCFDDVVQGCDDFYGVALWNFVACEVCLGQLGGI